jgi:hypothetical protein
MAGLSVKVRRLLSHIPIQNGHDQTLFEWDRDHVYGMVQPCCITIPEGFYVLCRKDRRGMVR